MAAHQGSRTIYFAGAIRGGRADSELYGEIVGELRRYGQVLTEHVADTQLAPAGERLEDTQIHDRDLAWLAESQFLVAEVTMPSLGVGYEVAKATGWGKPVLCLYRPADGRALSAMIAGCKDVSLRQYQSVSQLKDIFDEFFDR